MKTYSVVSKADGGHLVIDNEGNHHGMFGSPHEALAKVDELQGKEIKPKPKEEMVPEEPKKMAPFHKSVSVKKPVKKPVRKWK